MVLPFFGKKPQSGRDAGDSGSARRAEEHSSLMEFTRTGEGQQSLAEVAGKIVVTEVSGEDIAAVEEAAVLYANANERAAQGVLEEAVQGVSRNSESLWRMLFDLYRLIGDRQAFETHGVVYAQEFEKSPPIWAAAESTEAVAPQKASAAPAVNLTGTLSAAARPQFEQITRIAGRAGKLRIDCSRLRSVDEAGCELLAETLQTLQKSGVKVELPGAKHGLELLRPLLKVGEPQGRVIWLCALAMLQQLGEQAPFEDMAVDFAITFEESPPSWVPPVAQPDPTETAGVEIRHEESAPVREGFVLSGIISGPQPDVFRELGDYAAERKLVQIDASDVHRLEFVSAGSLFNLCAGLQTQGKQAVIRHPNEMVAALMRVMGIDQVAQIDYRKA